MSQNTPVLGVIVTKNIDYEIKAHIKSKPFFSKRRTITQEGLQRFGLKTNLAMILCQ